MGCARILAPTGTWVNGRLTFVYSEGTWGDGGWDFVVAVHVIGFLLVLVRCGW